MGSLNQEVSIIFVGVALSLDLLGGCLKIHLYLFFFFSFLSMEDKVPSLHLDSKTFPGLAGPLNSKASCITEFPGLARNRYSINVCSIYGLEAFLETI